MKKFIQGILFISLVIPILENIILFCNQVTEFFCTKIAVKTFKLKKELTDSEQTYETSAIGFKYTPVEEDEEYEEEED